MTSLPRALVLLAAFAAPLAFAAPAVAQDMTLAPAPKAKKPAKPAASASSTGERRPGELEGWTTSSSASSAQATTTKGRKLPAGAVSEKTMPDGGIPLPAEKSDSFAPPVAIDANGRPSGMFRF